MMYNCILFLKKTFFCYWNLWRHITTWQIHKTFFGTYVFSQLYYVKKKQSTQHLLVTSLIAQKSLSPLSELAQLVPLRNSQGSSTHFSDRLHEISLTIPRCYLDVYANSLFPCSARLWILCLWNSFLWPTIYSLNPLPFLKRGCGGIFQKWL